MSLWCLSRTSKGSEAEAKRIICVEEGWNLTKWSFFFVFFLQWKIRVSLAFKFICLRTPACCRMDNWRRLRTLGAASAWLYLWGFSAMTWYAAGRTGGAPAGGGGCQIGCCRG